MKQEQAVVDIYIADCCASFAVGRHVGELIVLAECLAVAGGTDTAGDVVLLAYDVVPDLVDCVDVGRVAGKRSHIGHSGIHVGGTNCVTYSLILLHNRLVGLAVFVGAGGVASLVEEELCLVEIFLVAGHEIELGKRHFGNLVSGYAYNLSGIVADFAAHTVGILDCDVEEVALSGSLVVGDCSFNHVAEVVELVRQILHHLPAL